MNAKRSSTYGAMDSFKWIWSVTSGSGSHPICMNRADVLRTAMESDPDHRQRAEANSFTSLE